MITRRAVLGAAVFFATKLSAGQEDLTMTPASDLDWTYLADTVMGGVSQGGARMEAGVLRLSGTVSTANRGGFIQARTEMPSGLPSAATALRLRVRAMVSGISCTSGPPARFCRGSITSRVFKLGQNGPR